MAGDLTKHLKSYTKDQLIARYNMKETYTNSQLKKIPKIELMEEIYGGGLKDGDAFSAFRSRTVPGVFWK